MYSSISGCLSGWQQSKSDSYELEQRKIKEKADQKSINDMEKVNVDCVINKLAKDTFTFVSSCTQKRKEGKEKVVVGCDMHWLIDFLKLLLSVSVTNRNKDDNSSSIQNKTVTVKFDN